METGPEAVQPLLPSVAAALHLARAPTGKRWAGFQCAQEDGAAQPRRHGCYGAEHLVLGACQWWARERSLVLLLALLAACTALACCVLLAVRLQVPGPERAPRQAEAS